MVHLGAIDVGSNAVRLLIKHAVEGDEGKVEFVKDLLVRVPLRLGDDAFVRGEISKRRISDLVSLMKSFKHLMHLYRVDDYRVCATAAMREAKNAKEVVQRVRRDTGMVIEVIDGTQEASLVYGTHMQELETQDHDYLYVDVGGGSTELNFVQKGKLIYSESFNIGTVRLLHGKVSAETEEAFVKGLKKIRSLRGDCSTPLSLVGSGGNINRLYRIAHLRGLSHEPLPLTTLRELHEHLVSMTPEERAVRYSLREDRADVIVPAGLIFIQVAETVGSEEILVPTLGLSDGIVRNLYDRKYSKKK